VTPRILVTGAHGFVGPHLIAALTAEFPAAEIRAATADVTDMTSVSDEVRSFVPEICFHLAAVSAVPQANRDPLGAWRVNLHGTLHLAAALQSHAPDCTLIFASSAEAYGLSFNSGGPVTEAAALAPASTYGATKAAADLALGALAQAGLRVIRVRPFNHIGRGQSDNFVVASFARQIALIEAGAQAPALSVGNLKAARDFLDVRDVCAAYVACCIRARELPRDAIINIASGHARRIGDVLQTLLGLTPVSVEVVADPARMRVSDIPVAAGNNELAGRLLGWKPSIAWSDTLSEVLDDWRVRVAVGSF
jgi:GDP-4-dehydro-6-deoxy-D-mannose reductase